MGEKEIMFCLTRRPETETALKLMHEMKPENRKTLRSEAAYLFDIVKKGPLVPQGFVTPQAARDKEEEAHTLALFLKAFHEKKYTRFCPNEQGDYEIVTRDHAGFTIEKKNGQLSYYHFKDWMDLKFFR